MALPVCRVGGPEEGGRQKSYLDLNTESRGWTFGCMQAEPLQRFLFNLGQRYFYRLSSLPANHNCIHAFHPLISVTADGEPNRRRPEIVSCGKCCRSLTPAAQVRPLMSDTIGVCNSCRVLTCVKFPKRFSKLPKSLQRVFHSFRLVLGSFGHFLYFRAEKPRNCSKVSKSLQRVFRSF